MTPPCGERALDQRPLRQRDLRCNFLHQPLRTVAPVLRAAWSGVSTTSSLRFASVAPRLLYSNAALYSGSTARPQFENLDEVVFAEGAMNRMISVDPVQIPD